MGVQIHTVLLVFSTVSFLLFSFVLHWCQQSRAGSRRCLLQVVAGCSKSGQPLTYLLSWQLSPRSVPLLGQKPLPPNPVPALGHSSPKIGFSSHELLCSLPQLWLQVTSQLSAVRISFLGTVYGSQSLQVRQHYSSPVPHQKWLNWFCFPLQPANKQEQGGASCTCSRTAQVSWWWQRGSCFLFLLKQWSWECQERQTPAPRGCGPKTAEGPCLEPM